MKSKIEKLIIITEYTNLVDSIRNQNPTLTIASDNTLIDIELYIRQIAIIDEMRISFF
jgi:hypothetical protein